MTSPALKPTMLELQRDIDRVDAAQDKHEAECALRYGNIDDKLTSFKETLDSNHRRSGRIEFAAWGVLISVVTILLGLVIKGNLG